jgi:membrane protease subunit (stomatin/prohibitin family)
MLHVSVTSNHHQADISVRGHGMLSATVWDPILFTFSVENFKHLDDGCYQIRQKCFNGNLYGFINITITVRFNHYDLLSYYRY